MLCKTVGGLMDGGWNEGLGRKGGGDGGKPPRGVVMLYLQGYRSAGYVRREWLRKGE